MKTTVLITACSLIVSFAQGGGKEVFVAVGRQGAVRGELIAVGDTALVVAVEKDEEEFTIIPLRDVRYVVIKGQDYVTPSAAIGLVSGGVLGAMIGAGMAEQPSGGMNLFSPATTGGLEGAGIGAVLGLAIGFGIGSSVSSKDVSVSPAENNFRQVLSNAARQPLGSDVGN